MNHLYKLVCILCLMGLYHTQTFARKLSNFHYEFCIGDDATIINETARQGFCSGIYDSNRGGTWHYDGWATILSLYDMDDQITMGFKRAINGGTVEHWVTRSAGYSTEKFYFTIDVKKPSMSFSGLETEYIVGDKGQFSISLGGDCPDFEGNGYFSYTYKSSRPDVLEISNTSGNKFSFTAKSTGSTYINIEMYAENSKYPSQIGKIPIGAIEAKVSVKPTQVTSIDLSKSELSLGINEKFTLDYTLLPSGSYSSVTWRSDDTSIATVSSNGVVTGKKSGKTSVYATTNNGITAKCDVTVDETIIVDGIRYCLNTKDKWACVYPLSNDKKYSGDITIPQSITVDGITYKNFEISSEAFKGCTQLSSIVMPSVTLILNDAFNGCTKLSTVRLNKVYYIGSKAFANCTGLKSIQMILEEPMSIGESAFSGCSNLKDVHIDNLTRWMKVTFDVNTFANPVYPGRANLHANGEKIEDLIVNSKTLKFATFARCNSIKTATFSEGIENIGGGRILQDCSNLESVTLPSTLKEIKGFSFAYCTSLRSVNCYATTPPNLATGWGNIDFDYYFAFVYSDPQNITLHVPKGTLSDYASAPGWSKFGLIVEDLDAGVDDIPSDDPDLAPTDVYNLQGIRVLKDATQADISNLAKGIYIIRGKKVVVR